MLRSPVEFHYHNRILIAILNNIPFHIYSLLIHIDMINPSVEPAVDSQGEAIQKKFFEFLEKYSHYSASSSATPTPPSRSMSMIKNHESLLRFISSKEKSSRPTKKTLCTSTTSISAYMRAPKIFAMLYNPSTIDLIHTYDEPSSSSW